MAASRLHSARFYAECTHRQPHFIAHSPADGCEKAREYARETMRDVREAMGLEYH